MTGLKVHNTDGRKERLNRLTQRLPPPRMMPGREHLSSQGNEALFCGTIFSGFTRNAQTISGRMGDALSFFLVKNTDRG